MKNILNVQKVMIDALLAIKEQSHTIDDLEELQSLIDTEFQKVMDATQAP